ATDLGCRLQVANLLLCCGRVLELCGRGFVRLLHQSAYRALLHAGTEHDSGPRPHCLVRRLWDAGARSHAFLLARAAAWKSLEERAACVCILGNQHRTRINGSLEHVAHRLNASLGISGIRNLVCALRGVLALRPSQSVALDANDW